MIKIEITITDTPLPDGRFHGQIEACPDNVEPVSDHERMIRDLIMKSIKLVGEYIGTEMPGVSNAFIAEIPSRLRPKRKKGGEDGTPDGYIRRG